MFLQLGCSNVAQVLLVLLSSLSIEAAEVAASTSRAELISQSLESMHRSVSRSSTKASTADDIEEPPCTYQELYPNQYIAYKTSKLSPEALDGDLSKEVWKEVPWSQDFVDIYYTTLPRLTTRMKIRWDNEFLYIGAELEDPKVFATLTEDDSLMFLENAFEVFVDPNSTTHFYKQFSMNALSKTWSLFMTKSFDEGGRENSTRVYGPEGWTMKPELRCAVKIDPDGVINDSTQPSKKWSLEVAMPLAKLIDYHKRELPEHGHFWRMNFERVQHHVDRDPVAHKWVKDPKCQSCPEPGAAGADWWVWSPVQHPDIHQPERWGILQFSTEAAGETAMVHYDEWPSRAAATAIFLAQRNYHAAHRAFAEKLEDLLEYSHHKFKICEAAKDQTTFELLTGGYVVSVASPAGKGIVATITNDRFLTVNRAR